MYDFMDGKTVLITGGTGTFGKKYIRKIFENSDPEKVIILSRDEHKQASIKKDFPMNDYPIRYFIGNIREKDRLYRAFEGVDYVIHAAALKRVPVAEYNPFEAVKTNILGAKNIVDVAIDKGVDKVIGLSTDKAVNPINLYGATKLVLEKIFTAGNSYVGEKNTTFSIVRYGNVAGSKGSVIPYFLNLVEKGENTLPITDKRMTRFWVTLDQAADLVSYALKESVGGEVFVPKVPSMEITKLAEAICPDCEQEEVGIRPGEKIHEVLISRSEARNTVINKESDLRFPNYVILPQFEFESKNVDKWADLPGVPEGFIYRSNENDEWLSINEMRDIIRKNQDLHLE